MADELVYLLLIETSGNQRHIFETNKLRENVGASQQIWQLGQVVLEAVYAAGGPDLRHNDEDGGDSSDLIMDETVNQPIETPGATVEVWYASSGKAMLFVRERAVGRTIVRTVTEHALREFPGVTVRGAIVPGEGSEGFPLSLDGLEHHVVQAHERLQRQRSVLEPAEARFQRLPIIAECRSSGLPANTFVQDGNDLPQRPAALTVAKKRELHQEAIERMQKLAARLQIARNIDDLETWLGESRYLAVIHADGTGMGLIFQNFRKYAAPSDVRDYIRRLRAFSLGIDHCTRSAFTAAVEELAQQHPKFIDYSNRTEETEWKVPLLPLIVGGDDVTVLCGGWVAVSLLTEFFRQFERAVAADPAVADVATRAFGIPRLGMCAGVALVKPHYPFSAAYAMAEDLQNAAKQAVKSRLRVSPGHTAGGADEEIVVPVTAFDFHLHHSASGDDIDQIRESICRESRSSGTGLRLWGGPYLTTDGIVDDPRLAGQRRWMVPRTERRLHERVEALNATDDTGELPSGGGTGARRLLPNSQLYALRIALHEGKEATASQLKLIRHRYEGSNGDDPFEPLLDDDQSPFWNEYPMSATAGESPKATEQTPAGNPVMHVSALLDAMSLARLQSR